MSHVGQGCLSGQINNTTGIKKKDDDELSRHPKVRFVKGRFSSVRQRLKALLFKRFHHFRRDLKGAFFELFLPVLLIAAATILVKLLSRLDNREEQPPLLLTPWLYGSTVMFYSSENVNSSDVAAQLSSSLLEPPGPSVRCMVDEPLRHEGLKCVEQENATWSPGEEQWPPYNSEQLCRCSSKANNKSQWTCDSTQSHRPRPPAIKLNTSDVATDLTGRNISQWLLDTFYQLRFKRYGGFSFDELNLDAFKGEEKRQAVWNVDTLLTSVAEFLKRTKVSITTDDLIANGSFKSNLTFGQVVKSMILNSDVEHNSKVWFNNKGWASLPAFVNVFSNALLRSSLGPNESAENYGILTTNHPMNYSAEEKLFDFSNLAPDFQIQLFQSVLVILAFSIVPASFVLFLIDERVSHAKHLQFVAGVPPWLYWLANYIWDMLNFLMPVGLVFLVFFASSADYYVGTWQSALAFFVLIMATGLAIVPLFYLFTFVFRVAPLAFVLLGGGAFFVGVVTTVTVVVLRFSVEETTNADEFLLKAYDICSVVFLVLPTYCLGSGMTTMGIFYVQRSAAKRFIEMTGVTVSIPEVNLFEWDLLGRPLTCLVVEAVIGFALLLLVEYRRHLSPCCFTCTRSLLRNRGLFTSDEQEDEDVLGERERLQKEAPESFGLMLRNLTKVYGCRRRLLAVKLLSVGVKKGECFGLLGVNGAGKTTTFKMITGKIPISAGDAMFHGLSVCNGLTRIHQMIGYCPQFDALNALLTGREQLTFYARIRNVHADDVVKVVDWAVSHMGLKKYADELTESYSGGNKRKLSTALALVGDPPVVLLDEPSTGMDPSSRRFLWNRIINLRRENRTVILTSHSMEECEALSTRLGIMVNGQLKCLGSVQHLKEKFGDGYTMTLKLNSANEADVRSVRDSVEAEFGEAAELLDIHYSSLKYKLPSGGVTLPQAFAAMRRIRSRLPTLLQDYALSQTTLDEIFVKLASEQADAAEREVVERPAEGTDSRRNSCSRGTLELAAEQPQLSAAEVSSS